MPGSFIAAHYPGSIRKGDDRISQEEYLKYLLEQYQNLIYSICLKSVGNPFDAEDLTQEVFLSAYKNLSRFDGTYEKAPGSAGKCQRKESLICMLGKNL